MVENTVKVVESAREAGAPIIPEDESKEEFE